MKFKVSEDINAPIETAWDHFTDFTMFENDVRGRGAEITRVGNWTETAEGVEWRGAVTIRGKRRAFSSKVSRMVPQDICILESRIGGMDCLYELNFVRLSPESTRVGLVLDLSAGTLTARLLLQTLKLARGRVLQRIKGVLTRQGTAAEAAHRRSKKQHV